MSLPARIEPDFFELAMAHSRHNLNDRAQTIVDLNGGNRIKNLDMRGMGSNATKDLGLMTVVSSADCFFIEGSRFALRSQREMNVGLDGAEIAPATEATLNADLAMGARLDLDMLRAFKSDIATMPVLVQYVQTIMNDLLSYSEQQIEQLQEFIQNYGDVNSIMKLDVLPQAMDSITSRLGLMIENLISDSKKLFDQGILPKSIVESVIEKVKTAQDKFDLPQLDIALEPLEGRINSETYLSQSIDDLKQSLVQLLDDPNLSDSQKAEIKASLNALETSLAEGKNPLQINQILAMISSGLSESVLVQLPETIRADITNKIERVNDAVYVVSASNLDVTIDQIRTLDQTMVSMAILDQNISQSLDTLSSAEIKILDEIRATLQMYNIIPFSLTTLGEIKNLQQSIANIDLQNPEFKPLRQSIGSLPMQSQTFSMSSDVMPQILGKNIDRTVNQLASILSIKTGISEADVILQAVTLRSISGAIPNQIAINQNKDEIQNFTMLLVGIRTLQTTPYSTQSLVILNQISQSPLMLDSKLSAEIKLINSTFPSITLSSEQSNVISLKQPSPINLSSIQTQFKNALEKSSQTISSSSISNDTNKLPLAQNPALLLPASKAMTILKNIISISNQLPRIVTSVVPAPVNPSVKPSIVPIIMPVTLVASTTASKNIPASNTNTPNTLSQRVNEVTKSIGNFIDSQTNILKKITDNIMTTISDPESKLTKLLEGLRDTTIKLSPLPLLPTDPTPNKIKTKFNTACGDPGGASCRCFNDKSKPSGASETTDPKADAIHALGEKKFNEIRNAELDNAKKIENTEIVWGSNNKPQNIITVKISEGVNKLKELFGISVSNTIRPMPSVKLDEVTMNSVTRIEVLSEAESSLSGFKGSGKTRTRAPSFSTNG